ncbi:DUF192 domain-containing protein [Halobacteriales archaeon QS_3_64_16]|nr:MAG: DUF192 domain-containing protein [Halobacteriales archaeon QS_3_64_16]
MDRRRVLSGLFALTAFALAVLVLLSTFPSLVGLVIVEPDWSEYGSATVEIRDQRTDRTLATVDVRLAESYEEKYTGLSDTRTLRNGTGMLFVYEQEERRTFVMRDMDYPLDIVFIGADGRIDEIVQAPAPGPNEDGNDIQRTGSAKWILEVPRGWMAAQNVTEGDRIVIDRDGNGSSTANQ